MTCGTTDSQDWSEAGDDAEAGEAHHTCSDTKEDVDKEDSTYEDDDEGEGGEGADQDAACDDNSSSFDIDGGRYGDNSDDNDRHRRQSRSQLPPPRSVQR